MSACTDIRRLGNFYREGHLYTQEELKTYDPDFKSYAEGTVVPHGFYDLKLNVGYVQLGIIHDTSEFAYDSFRHLWYTHGQQNYPSASAILILCDGGGSNSSLHYIFKQDLQILADEIGIEIRIAHYPPLWLLVLSGLTKSIDGNIVIPCLYR